ncbi:MAG: 3'(2'),5'-bisphosphate nucleotidase CysQ family protein [Thermomicrobiales bacterium]
METSSSSSAGTSWAKELDVALEAVQAASKAILGFYTSRDAETYTKGDGSPVTDADFAADMVIREIIGAAFPDDALLTEEGAKDLARVDNTRCWVVDPLDGTAQFVVGTDSFEVLIALVSEGRPVVAVSAHPPSGIIHAAVTGEGAWLIDEAGRHPWLLTPSQQPPRIVSSKWYRGHQGRQLILKVAHELGAEDPPILEIGFQPRAFDDRIRTYDVFIGLWPEGAESIAQEWDLAASDLIINEAGGRFTDMWGRYHQYNKRNTSISGGILTSADVAIHERVLEAFAAERPHEAPPADPADA